MDKITDILSTFFVSSKNITQNKQQHIKDTPKKNNLTIPSTDTSTRSDSISSNKSRSSDNTLQKKLPDEKVKIDEKIKVKKNANKTPDEKVKVKYAKKISDEKIKVKNAKKTSGKKLPGEVKEQIYSDLSSYISENIINVFDKIENETENNINVVDKIENETDMKKYILKSNELYKKNINIVFDSFSNGLDILFDLLYKISLIKDISEIYDNTIHIITEVSNKKLYKQMLLENPYLYFTDFNVKSSFSEASNDKKTRIVYIFDNFMANKYKSHIDKMINSNVQIFILTNIDDKTGFDTYSILGKNRILIYKPNKLKMFQKKFYSYYVKTLSLFSNFEKYYTCINNENLDVKYIILKDDELRYN